MNVEPSGRRPKTKPDERRLYRLPETTPTIAIYYYYSPPKLTLVYRPTEGRGLSRPSWLVTYRDGLPVHRRSPILVLTGSDVDPGQRVTTKPNRQPRMARILSQCSTLVRNTVVRAIHTVNGRLGNSTPRGSKTPEPIEMKLYMAWWLITSPTLPHMHTLVNAP